MRLSSLSEPSPAVAVRNRIEIDKELLAPAPGVVAADRVDEAPLRDGQQPTARVDG